jgi:hypothetical protein
MKWTMRVADALRRTLAPSSIDDSVLVDVASIEGGAVPSQRQLDENAVIGAHRTVPLDALSDLIAEEFDVIICNTVGSRLWQLTELIRARDRSVGTNGALRRRPVVVTGYAGVVYEKHTEGALWRASADVVCCNSLDDFLRFERLYRSLGLDSSVLVRSGLAVADAGWSAASRELRTGAAQTLTFAVQPDVPKALRERRYLLERLVSLARSDPKRNVIVKLRSRPDEHTTHRERHHYQELFERYFVDRPPNLSFEYGLMSEVLERTDVLVTVSSTAALEAIAAGRRAAILTDVGVREGLGNHFFADSGLLRSIDELAAGDIPDVDVAWLERNGFAPEDSLDNVVCRVRELLESGPGPVPSAFYSTLRTPHLLEHLALASPPSASADGRRRSNWARVGLARLVRGPIRRAYRRFDRWVER